MATRKKAEATEAEAQQDAPAEAQQGEESERVKRARLKTQAINQLIENHRDEFNQIAEQTFTENGLEFKRRLTDEEKAEQELAKLLERNPNLRSKLNNYASAPQGEQHEGDLNLTRSFEQVGGYEQVDQEAEPATA